MTEIRQDTHRIYRDMTVNIVFKEIIRLTWLQVFGSMAEKRIFMTICEAIAKAIQDSGKTRYKIWQETGIDQALLCRLLQGGSCSMETADKLCRYLGLELKPKARKEK